MTGGIRVLGASFVLAGCAAIVPDTGPAPERVEAEPPASAPRDDTTSGVDRLPGTTVASLGDVSEPGLWLRTPLVSGAMRGRVRDPATGRAVALELRPLDADPGAGSRMSLAAYRSLGLALTALPELRVEAGG